MTKEEIKRRLLNMERRISIRTEQDKRDFEALEAVLFLLEQKPCIYNLKDRYCSRLNEYGMLKYPLQEQTFDNATNGDVIKAMFDIAEEHFYDKDRMVDVYGLDRKDDPVTFYADWWNAPYQKGDKE